MDTLVFSHLTALRALRLARRSYAAIPWRALAAGEQRRVLQACKPNRKMLDYALLNRYGLWEPDEDDRVDVLISNSVNRRTISPISCHLISRELPPGSILEIEKGLYCTSPAFTAYLYSRNRTVPHVTSLLMELMGTYTLLPELTMPIAPECITANHGAGRHGPDAGMHPHHSPIGSFDPDCCDSPDFPQDEQPRSPKSAFRLSSSNELPAADQARYSCEPAITTKQLKTLAAWTKSSRCLSFRQAIELAAPGSASPAETILYCMLGFPMRYGGFACSNLPKGMLLNHRIDFTHDAVLMSSGMPYAIADIYIPSANTDIEYNGIGHEELPARIHDGNRNNGLRGMGINVIVIQRDQMRDISALEAIARTAYRFAGVRFRYQGTGNRAKQETLLNALRAAAGLPPA